MNDESAAESNYKSTPPTNRKVRNPFDKALIGSLHKPICRYVFTKLLYLYYVPTRLGTLINFLAIERVKVLHRLRSTGFISVPACARSTRSKAKACFGGTSTRPVL